MNLAERAKAFLTVGENLHATRSLSLQNKRVERLPDGSEAIRFALNGKKLRLPIPASYRQTEHYQNGRLRHVAIALELARRGAPAEQAAGREYLAFLAEEQLERGARWLDLNTDEVSPDPAEQLAAMEFLAEYIGRVSPKPLSIDSSNAATLRAGLDRCPKAKGRPILNSVALDRPEALELVRGRELEVVASAAAVGGIPQDLAGRQENLRRIIGELEKRGLARDRMHLDPLILPVAALPGAGQAVLDCIRWIREEYGPAIHITGGFSNVSFGLPARKFINLVMLRLVMEAGADSGLIDPVQLSPREAAALDPASEAVRLATTVLLSDDMAASVEFLTAAEEGKIPKG